MRIIDLAEKFAAAVYIAGVRRIVLAVHTLAAGETQSVLMWMSRAFDTAQSRARRCGSNELIGATSGSSACANCFTSPMQLMTICGRTSAKSCVRLSKFPTSTPTAIFCRNSVGSKRSPASDLTDPTTGYRLPINEITKRRMTEHTGRA